MVPDNVNLSPHIVPILHLARLTGCEDGVRDPRKQGTTIAVHRAWGKDDMPACRNTHYAMNG